MKKGLITIILYFVFHLSFGQACGVYRLIYSGEIESDSAIVKSVKLPNTSFLHGFGKLDSGLEFTEIKLKENKIEYQAYSHLTSVFTKAEKLFHLYKSNRDSFPIILNLVRLGENIKIIKEVSWDDISIKVILDDELDTLFKIDLKKIKLE